MTLLALGLFIFIGMHSLPSFVGLRRSLIFRLGEGPYKGLFALVSLTGFVLIVIGKSRAEFQPIWNPPAWGKEAAALLMVFSLILLAAGNMQTNIKRYTRHPMLWGVTLWACAHLLANGDFASLMLFGSLGVFSLFGMVSANLRGAVKQTTQYPFRKDMVTVIGGLVAYGGFLFLHPYLFGVSIIQ